MIDILNPRMEDFAAASGLAPVKAPQAWEDVADDVSGAVQKALQPLLKQAADDIYSRLLDTTQDYLADNVAFNLASRISAAESEAASDRQRVREITADRDRLLIAIQGAMNILGNAESNASGNPEWDYVGPRIAAVRTAVAQSSAVVF